MIKYFGTDGIRGRAHEFLTPELAKKVGLGLSLLACKEVIVGQDTRASGAVLAAAITEGALEAGIDVYRAGVVTTPMLSHLSKRKQTFGVMISGSHNPYHDNGIKVFNCGRKLSQDEENILEFFLNGKASLKPMSRGREMALEDGFQIYKELFEDFSVDTDLKIGLDFANGAAWDVGKKIFAHLGWNFHSVGDEPDGKNINAGCGSTHPENIAGFVRENAFDLGFTFDGDADRVLAVDGGGEIYNGDHLIYVFARHMLEEGSLNGRGVVLTRMSNLGLFKALKELGIAVETTDVGDKYVFEALEKTGYVLGGEASGHIINLNLLDTGDGLLNAAYLVKILTAKNISLAEATKELKMYPEISFNLRDVSKEVLKIPEVKAEIKNMQKNLGANGKIVVRPSGTEPVIRISVSAECGEEAEAYLERIVELLKGWGR